VGVFVKNTVTYLYRAHPVIN